MVTGKWLGLLAFWHTTIGHVGEGREHEDPTLRQQVHLTMRIVRWSYLSPFCFASDKHWRAPNLPSIREGLDGLLQFCSFRSS
jgi:hypothetical protein